MRVAGETAEHVIGPPEGRLAKTTQSLRNRGRRNA